MVRSPRVAFERQPTPWRPSMMNARQKAPRSSMASPAAHLPPPPYRTQSLPQNPGGPPHDELASWPGELADQEGVVSENGK